MECRILACEQVVFSGAARGVFARGLGGWFGVLPGHAPAAFALADAPVRVHTNGGTRVFQVKRGVLHVRPESVTVLADVVTERA
ncbi:MAG: F0F1 ATP synthase subunit epsilon [Candidatus Bipolaricaulaceae bacterium]